MLGFYKQEKYVNKTEKRQTHRYTTKQFVKHNQSHASINQGKNYFNFVFKSHIYVHHVPWPDFKFVFIVPYVCPFFWSLQIPQYHCLLITTPFLCLCANNLDLSGFFARSDP